MDNVAKIAACPSSLPYFNVATTGHTTLQQQGQMTGGLGWSLVTAAAPAGLAQLFGKTLLTSETLGLQLNQQNIDAWDTAPSLDPIQLIAMQGLYHKALGLPMSSAQVAVLDKFYRAEEVAKPEPSTPTPTKKQGGEEIESTEVKPAAALHKPTKEYLLILRSMYDELGPGWLQVTPKKCVPKDVCYVACDKDTYVWVTKDGVGQLTNLTILIIDAATRDTSQDTGGTPRTTQTRFQLPLSPPAPSLGG
jgi:hypothetical protein